MQFVRIVVQSIGVLALLIGGLWIGQGLGLIMWPASSFMLGISQWAWNGLFVFLGGLACIYFARRR